MRGVAALAVLTWHLFGHFGRPPPLPSAYLAVDLFFCLSGFVLSYAYSERFRSGMGPGEFMARRLIRLWPLYLLGGVVNLLAFIVRHIKTGLVPMDLVAQFLDLLYIPLPIGERLVFVPVNFPAWSLVFELLVNIAFAFAAIHLNRVKPLGGLILLSAVVLIATGLHFQSLDVGSRWSNFYAGFGRVSYGFFAGVAIEKIYGRKPIHLHPSCATGLLLLLVFIFSIDAGRYRAEIDLICAIVIFPILVYLGASCEPSRLGAGAMGILGKSSYAMYVLQIPLLLMFAKSLSLAHIEFGAVQALAFIVAVVGIALLADAKYDWPVRLWLSRRLPSGAPGGPGARKKGRMKEFG
jgi:peptidoglycan/LPS O-acetylase OafA/YrhL